MAYYFGLLSVNYRPLCSIVAYYYGLLSVNYGLLWSIVAYYFGLLGVPGSSKLWATGFPGWPHDYQYLFPGKQVAHNLGLLWLHNGLFWGIAAHNFGLLGFRA